MLTFGMSEDTAPLMIEINYLESVAVLLESDTVVHIATHTFTHTLVRPLHNSSSIAFVDHPVRE